MRDIIFQNMVNHKLEFDLSRSLKVKSSGVVGLPIYDFRLVSNSNYMSDAHRLGVTATQKFFSCLLSLGPNFDPPPTHPYLGRPYLGRFFSKSNAFLLMSEERSPPKMKLIRLIFLEIYCIETDRQTDRHTK